VTVTRVVVRCDTARTAVHTSVRRPDDVRDGCVPGVRCDSTHTYPSRETSTIGVVQCSEHRGGCGAEYTLTLELVDGAAGDETSESGGGVLRGGGA